MITREKEERGRQEGRDYPPTELSYPAWHVFRVIQQNFYLCHGDAWHLMMSLFDGYMNVYRNILNKQGIMCPAIHRYTIVDVEWSKTEL